MEPSGAPPWANDAYTDKEGRRWRMLNVRRLFVDDAFVAAVPALRAAGAELADATAHDGDVSLQPAHAHQL